MAAKIITHYGQNISLGTWYVNISPTFSWDEFAKTNNLSWISLAYPLSALFFEKNDRAFRKLAIILKRPLNNARK